MVRHPEGAGDDRGHPGQGPEVGAEPVGWGALEEQLQELPPLSGSHPRGATRWRLRPERIRTPGLDLGLPAADGRRGAANLPGDLPNAQPAREAGNGLATPCFQLCGTPVWSHAWEDTIVPLFGKGQ